MERSVELKNDILGLYESMSKGDATAVINLYSHQNGVLSIGTDANEWWEGYAVLAPVVKAQLQEMGGIQIIPGNLKAFVEGNVGWVADRPIIQLLNGEEIILRLTAVFHKERGGWKIVQRHVSIGKPNVETIGKELTTR